MRPKTNFKLSPIHFSHKSSNQKFPKNHRIGPDTNLHITYTNVKDKLFEALVPSVLPLSKKHIRLGHAGILDHSVHLSTPELKKKFFFKGMDRSNKKIKI